MMSIPLRTLALALSVLCALPAIGVSQAPSTSDPVGDYVSEVQMILQRDFLVPASIPQSEREGLRVGVSVVIGPNRRIRSIEIADRSGNEAFDRAVEEHIARLLAARPRFPNPPAAARSRFVGVPIIVAFVPPTARTSSSAPPTTP